MANSNPRPKVSTMSDLAIFAILPMVLLGGSLAGLVASGVLSLKSSTDGKGAVEAVLLGPAGVLITGKDEVKLRSSNGLVTVAVPAGSVSSPITLNYHEAGVSDRPEMPQGFTGAGVYFRLSVTSSDAGGDPVDLQRMLSITVAIGPDELALAEADYSRFVIHHYMDRFQNWEALSPRPTR